MSVEILTELTLKVAEAFSKDVGRGLARIDPEDMELLGAEIGDIVEITGKRTTVAKLMPTFSGDRKKSIIQIDGIVRSNAEVGVDDKVKIRKTTAQSASVIELSSSKQARRDTRYIGKLLGGLPVIKGDVVRITFFGTRYQEFTVVNTRPQGAVIVHYKTSIQFKKAEETIRQENKISYEDVGGLGKEIRKIREMIELPLKYPELL